MSKTTVFSIESSNVWYTCVAVFSATICLLAMASFFVPAMLYAQSIGEDIVTTEQLVIRSDPSVEGTSNILGEQQRGAIGTILEGPVQAGGYTWFRINFRTNPDGWAVADWVELPQNPLPPPPPPGSPPPPPPPPPSPPTSTKFNIGDRVETTANLNIRLQPGTGVLGAQATGFQGVITAGPEWAGSFWYWEVDFDNAPDGWSAENWLELATGPPPPPPPPPGPPPPPPPPPAPSTKFNVGDKVQTTANLNVREQPGVNVFGAQPTGYQGVVTGGPVKSGGYWYWEVDFDNAPDGWSAENWLELATGPPPPPPPPPGPPPPPPPPPAPSTAFKPGDRVMTTDNLNVRSQPSVGVLGVQPTGSQGSIVSGPVEASGYWWWEVNYDNGVDGWSAEPWLADVAVTTPPPVPPGPWVRPNRGPVPAQLQPNTVGQKIETSEQLIVRSSPSLNAPILGEQSFRSAGTVVAESVQADGYTWWKVDYNLAPWGWSVSEFMYFVP